MINPVVCPSCNGARGFHTPHDDGWQPCSTCAVAYGQLDVDQILKYDAERTSPCSDAVASCLRKIAEKPHRAPLYLADLAAAARADAERERDEARAEVARLRARVRVEAEDVERAGVTRAHVEAWLAASGRWSISFSDPQWPVWKLLNATGARVVIGDGARQTARVVDAVAFCQGRSPWDILDEMAAMVVE